MSHRCTHMSGIHTCTQNIHEYICTRTMQMRAYAILTYTYVYEHTQPHSHAMYIRACTQTHKHVHARTHTSTNNTPMYVRMLSAVGCLFLFETSPRAATSDKGGTRPGSDPHDIWTQQQHFGQYWSPEEVWCQWSYL